MWLKELIVLPIENHLVCLRELILLTFQQWFPCGFGTFAVASGNCFIVKPSERVSMTQEAIFKLVDQCGFPPE